VKGLFPRVIFMEKKIFCLLFFSGTLMLGSGCGSGTGSPPDSATPGILRNETVPEGRERPEDSHPSVFGKKLTLLRGPGTLTVKVARGGSALPPGTWGVFLTFDEVSVYKEDEGWVSLPLKHNPYRIELFRLPLGEAAALTDPAELPPGRYSRIRIGIQEANILVPQSNHQISIPNYSLKTEKDIEFEIDNVTPIDLVSVMDLGKSIQPFGVSYRLFPTFYAIEDAKAAAIHGSIQGISGLGGASHYRRRIFVIVYRDKERNGRASSDEEIGRLAVRKGTGSSVFEIRWLAPQENYIVTVEENGRVIYKELVEAQNLSEGSVWDLNKGKPI